MRRYVTLRGGISFRINVLYDIILNARKLGAVACDHTIDDIIGITSELELFCGKCYDY